MLKEDRHVHLYGCLTARDLWEIGKDRYKSRRNFLEYYASEFEKVFARRPDYKAYWQKENGLSLLEKDFLFLEPSCFEAFQAKFNLIIALCPILPDCFSVAGYVIDQMSEQSIDLFEARTLIPLSFDRDDAERYLKGLCLLVERKNLEYSMQTKLVFCLFRENSLAEKHYRWIKDFKGAYPKLGSLVTGIDFAYNEKKHPPKFKKNFVQRFFEDQKKDFPLDLMYHVGESYEDKSLVSAIRWIVESADLGIKRLGHAVALGINPGHYLDVELLEDSLEYQDSLNWLRSFAPVFSDYGYKPNLLLFEKNFRVQAPQEKRIKIKYTKEFIEEMTLLQKAAALYLKEKDVCIEVCPTSNQRISGLEEDSYHPLRFFHQMEMKILLGSDDPGIMATSWQKEKNLYHRLCS